MTHPPSGPSTPPPPSGPKHQAAEVLTLIDEHLLVALGMAALALPEPSDRVETCGIEILGFRLRRARAAVADLLKYSGRDEEDIAAAVASRPVQPPPPGGRHCPAGTSPCPARRSSRSASVRFTTRCRDPADGPPGQAAAVEAAAQADQHQAHPLTQEAGQPHARGGPPGSIPP
jgi:hypothetical protein